MPKPSAYLQTVDRALQILLMFDQNRTELTINEVSRALGIHRSIAYRTMVTLQRRGFLTREERSGRFRLGMKVVELANIVLAAIDLRRIAHPILAWLARETGESAFLTVVSDDESMCLDVVESNLPVRVSLTVGGRYPLYAGASNKVLLAYLPPAKIEAVIARGLQPITSHTITSAEHLRQDLAAIRQRGWAYTVGELTPEVAALAVPIKDTNDNLVAAVSVAGLVSRFTEDRIPHLLNLTRQAAADISAQLVSWRN